MLYLTGLIGILTLLSVVLYLTKTTPGFKLSEKTVSHLATLPKTKNILFATFLVYAFLRFVFFSALFSRLSLWNNFFIVSTIAIAFCSFIITTIITSSKNQTIHRLSAMISGISTIFFILFLGIQLLHNSVFIGVINIVIANNMLLSLFVASRKGINGNYQLYYVINIIIWDIIIALFLLALIR